MVADNKILIREVGPREGIQIAGAAIPTSQKVELIKLLTKTNVKHIEVAAFVSEKIMPHMSDAEMICESLPHTDGTEFTALYLNFKGFKRMLACPNLVKQGWIYTAGSDTFLQKNYGRSEVQLLAELPEWQKLFQEQQINTTALMFSSAFGCNYEGAISQDKVLARIQKIVDAASNTNLFLHEICLADTVGHGTSAQVVSLVSEVHRLFPKQTLSLHLHDTGGRGIDNAVAAAEHGVRIFDASFGGVGGCPFAKGARGNIATEILAAKLTELGFETGINLDHYSNVLDYAKNTMGLKLHAYE